MLNPCARESKARTGRFLREKLISDHGLFSSYEGQQGAATWQYFLGRFSGVYRALDGWMLARAPASPAQGLSPPWTSVFDYFCMTCGLEKLGLLIKTDWGVSCPLYC